MFEKNAVKEAKDSPCGAGDSGAVRLKPVLGIRPGVYLSAIYALVLLGLLFFTLCYPGLSNPGSLISFRSEPSGAAVRVDGITLGAAPCELFIPRGRRQFELVLPGFSPYRTEREVPGRVFASLLVPRRDALEGKLEAAEPLRPFLLAAADYAAWSFAGEPSAAYQIPQSLSEGAYRAGPAAATDPAARAAMEALLREAPRFALTRAALRDLLRAKFLLDNGGLSPSPLSLVSSLSSITAALAETPGSAAWLAGLLPAEAAAPVAASPWYKKTLEAAAALEAEPAALPAPGGRLELGALFFREIPGGAFTTGGAFPRRVQIEGFRIAETELSPRAWELFLAANPGWGRENLEELAAQGLVSPDYLVPWSSGDPAAPGDSALAGLSWYAAEAYCRWLSGLLPPSMAALEVRLPREAEWEYAAKLVLQSPANTPDLPRDLLGGRWEWCEDPFAPLDFFPPAAGEAPRFPSPERSLRGGSWVNPAGSVGAETRASLPPETCSPFVSFRPVIAPRRLP
jgi:formylglycine-generating enzyme required for sulfatase activity